MDEMISTVDEWRALGVMCEAVHYVGYGTWVKCHNRRKFGRLCTIHYRVAERDITRLRLDYPEDLRTPA